MSANQRSKTHFGFPYHEASVNFADTAAEVTSAAITVTLPVEFRFDSPIVVRLKIGEVAMDDNALLLEPSFAITANRVVASLRFHNANAAGGANINPGAKIFTFTQL